jgi:hypothetical protein
MVAVRNCSMVRLGIGTPDVGGGVSIVGRPALGLLGLDGAIGCTVPRVGAGETPVVGTGVTATGAPVGRSMVGMPILGLDGALGDTTLGDGKPVVGNDVRAVGWRLVGGRGIPVLGK